MARKRRRTVELLGLNNGRVCCRAYRQDGVWYCVIDDEPEIYVDTMKHAENRLREIGLATKIVRCPELPAKA